MDWPLEVVIVIAKCNQRHQEFGIRFEKKQGLWVGDWAFAVTEQQAKKEGYQQQTVAGEFKFVEQYPGCPHCKAQGIYKCASCGRVACWDTELEEVVCPWCQTRLKMKGAIEELTAENDL